VLRVNCCEFFLKKRCFIKGEKRKKERKKATNYVEANSGSAYPGPGNFWEQEGTASHSPRFKRSVLNGAVRPSRRRTAVDGVKRSRPSFPKLARRPDATDYSTPAVPREGCFML